MTRFTIWLIVLTGIMGCGAGDEPMAADDQLLASVYTKKLLLSDIRDRVPAGQNPADSALMVNAIIERWVRETLLMQEAEKNIPKDLNIDQLVRDYRASLVKHNYEKLLVELQLDSIVPAAELQQYYEAHEEQYTLDYSITRCHFIKVSRDHPGLDDLKKWWKNYEDEETFNQILNYATTYAQVYLLDENAWYRKSEVQAYLPNNKISFSDMSEGRKFEFQNDDFLFLLRVFESISSGRTAPLAYVEDQITNVILHQRKIALLHKKTEELYERETRRNNVHIGEQ